MTLDELAEDRSRKSSVVQALRARNCYGLSVSEQTKLDVECARAQRELDAANAAYHRAVADAARLKD
jgi:hypothetical protein